MHINTICTAWPTKIYNDKKKYKPLTEMFLNAFSLRVYNFWMLLFNPADQIYMMSKCLALKITGEKTMFRAPIKVRKIHTVLSACRFSSIEHTSRYAYCWFIAVLLKLHYAIFSDFYWCSKHCSFSCYTKYNCFRCLWNSIDRK